MYIPYFCLYSVCFCLCKLPEDWLKCHATQCSGSINLSLSYNIHLLVRVKLGYPPNFNFLGKPLLGEKYVEGRRKKEE